MICKLMISILSLFLIANNLVAQSMISFSDGNWIIKYPST
jgi:hypothetical protein